MKTAFYTLGCKLNQSESEALVSSFDNRGFLVTKASDHADLYIVNSCTVTTKAEQKTRRMIRKFARENPDSIVLVTGCYAQVEPDELSKLDKNVFIVSMDRKHTLLNLPDAILEGESHGLSLLEAVSDFLSVSESQIIKDKDRFNFDTSSFSDHARAYLKIQDGCNNSCAYCRVTIARGNSVSLSLDKVVSRALNLEAAGYREVILTGVNITDYKDPGNERNRLPALIIALTSSLKTVRIRLSSLEPDMIDRDLAQAVSHKSVVPHFHIPIQSGSNSILEKINRHYTAERVEEAVKLLRKAKYDPFVAADLIIGLPGESQEDFEDSFNLVKTLKLSQLHLFPYSPRPGTALFLAKNRVPERVTKERIARVNKLTSGLNKSYLERWIGREVEVVLEKYIESSSKACLASTNLNFWSGLSENYLHVSLKGLDNDISYRGRLVKCRIDNIENGIKCEFIRFL
ncbi:MAG: tRNA (N(6)-L-threonylcarbamoyladenosine(37)-C(2))-methylthiotransferase MtaB [Spirochaetia bacterium]|jgi:threonylcarbamoyladenosine tRNA methylthiotransferase MtaB|nr:tRNA (N(6)-L-threonylcarbamoyladenosine(37)-C(2))-methylthiotransferase MtaB [Spirochaetia bacterium]